LTLAFGLTSFSSCRGILSWAKLSVQCGVNINTGGEHCTRILGTLHLSTCCIAFCMTGN
jgi:hypothetical protein